MNLPRRTYRIAALLSYCLLFATRLMVAADSVSAGNTSSQTNGSRTDADSKVVELSPFEIGTEQDRGYTTTNTASGGRLSTNLLKTPADITVQNRDFLDDLTLFSLNEAYVWLPGATATDPGTASDFGANYTFRGMGAGGTNTRNYFRFDTTVEDFNTERLENARGPNGILYGDSNVSGTTNVNSKRAVFRNFTTIGFLTDSEGSLRGSIDTNLKLTSKLAVRANVMWQERKSFIDTFYDNKKAAAVAVTYRPWAGSEIRYDGEYVFGQKSRTPADGFRYNDGVSLYDGATTYAGTATLPATLPAGIGRNSANTRLTISPGWTGYQNFANRPITVGTGQSLLNEARPLANFPILPSRGFQVGPPDSRADTHQYVTSLTFEHTFENKLTFEIAGMTTAVKRDSFGFGSASQTSYFIDINSTLPDGSANPNVGKGYTEGRIAQNEVDQYINDLRISAAYPVELSFLKQTFSVGVDRRDKLFDVRNYEYDNAAGANPALTNATNQIFVRRYWNNVGAPFIFPENVGGIVVAKGQTRDTRNTDRLDTLQLNTVGQYFHDSLAVIAGFRRDFYIADTREGATFTPAGTVATYNRTHFRTGNNVKTYGATYFPIPQIGVYANYSEGFLPSFSQNPYVGQEPKFVKKQDSKSAGLRFNLFKNRLVGTAGYYEQKETNRASNFNGVEVNNILTALGEPIIPVVNTSTFGDTQTLAGRGYEFDFTGNPTPELKMIFNVVIPVEAIQTDTNPGIKAYVAENLPRFEAAANSGIATAATIRSNITALQSRLLGLVDGRTANNFIKWRANILGKYRFSSGKLRGFSVGGGANLFGKQVVGNRADSPFNYFYTQEYYVVRGSVGYDFKWRRFPIQLDLSVSNLLDHDKPVYEDTSVYAGTTFGNDYHFIDPRKGTLSVKVRF